MTETHVLRLHRRNLSLRANEVATHVIATNDEASNPDVREVRPRGHIRRTSPVFPMRGRR